LERFIGGEEKTVLFPPVNKGGKIKKGEGNKPLPYMSGGGKTPA